MKYNFNKRDLLESRENYMYSPFYGKKFLVDYNKNRSLFIKSLKSENILRKNIYLNNLIHFILVNKINNKELGKLFITHITKDTHLLDKLIYNSILKFKKVTIIDTDKLLNSLIINSIENNKTLVVDNFIEKLIKKFEVSKKLYTNYSKDFKKKGRQYKFTQIYMKLSLLLTIEYIKKPNNRYLSTLLKLNDLISSSKLVLLEIFHDELLIIFELEKTFINNLIKKNKITI